MRLICTLDDQHRAYALSTFLIHHGIENQLELITNTDWGSNEYGTATCHIWSFDEDQLEPALQYVNEFLQNPDDPRFYAYMQENPPPFKESALNPEGPNQKEIPMSTNQLGTLTSAILIICILLFMTASLTAPTVTHLPPASIPYTPILSAPISKELMYDYPQAYEIVDRIISTYGTEALVHTETLPPAGQELLQKFYKTPFWHGFYEMVVTHLKKPDTSWQFDAPMFEKIQQGEVWRLFTPVLLHHDIFHIFFNMIWLVILGKQMEQRLTKGRYLLFILIAGIISNTAQYFMSGANFIGFSGILCAMLAFIWVKQRNSPWEGYQLERGTIALIAFFVLFMLTLQIASFIVEISSDTSFFIGIANTAHLVGAATGFALAKSNYFTWNQKA